MPLPKTSPAREWGPSSIPAEGATRADVEIIEIPVIHEMGPDLAGSIIESTRLIKPSRRPVVVKVESQVVTRGLQGMHSPEYLATIRRRVSRKLGTAIAGLAEHAAREDFAVCTYPIVKQINGLLATLAQADTEGNTREILRQLRNTLMNGGWQKYREPAARIKAIEILSCLAEEEEVFPQRVEEVFNRLYDAGLNPVGAPLFAADEEDMPHAQDEVPR